MVELKTEHFAIDSIPNHEPVDPAGWFRVKIALGPCLRWSEYGSGRWVEDEDARKTVKDTGGRALPRRSYRLEPAIHQTGPLPGDIANGLITESNAWRDANNFAREVHAQQHETDASGDRVVNQLFLRGNANRMIAVLNIEPCDAPATREGDMVVFAKTFVSELIKAGFAAPPAAKSK